MAKRHRLDLAEFLSKPRFLHEIAEHYMISRRTAALHLRKAVKSGLVMKTESSAFRIVEDSGGDLRKLGTLACFHGRNSNVFSKEAKHSLLKTAKHGTLTKISSKSFMLKTEVRRKTIGGNECSIHVSSKGMNMPELNAKLEAHNSAMTKLNASPARVTSVSSVRSSQSLPSRMHLEDASNSLLNAERIRMFQALLKHSMSFLDMHAQFNVSKQIITRLMDNGLLEEIWGQDGVGLAFKLTPKGQKHVAQLAKLSAYKPHIKQSPLTKLKQKSAL
jgi:predicted DNA-binding protein YlxM (UPF0122 family)